MGPVSVRKRDQSTEQAVSRLRAERDQLMRDNEVLAQERRSAIAQAEDAQRKARASPDERKSALKSPNESLETALGLSKEAIAAMAESAVRAKGRATRRLEAARASEAIAIDAATKAQTQRDELASLWRTWKQQSKPLGVFPTRSTRSRRPRRLGPSLQFRGRRRRRVASRRCGRTSLTTRMSRCARRREDQQSLECGVGRR